MAHDPSHTNGRVDVSVLIPVLNEERHIRATVATMREQALDGELEFLFADGRSDDDTKAILQEMAREDERIVVLDNPRRTTFGLNVGAARVARPLRGADGRALVLPRPLPRRGHRAARARRGRRRRVGRRAGRAARQRRHLQRGRRRARLAPRRRRLEQVAHERHARAAEKRHRHRRLRRRLAARDGRPPRRLGRRLARQPGLRAGRARACRGAAASSACRRWRPSTCRGAT